LSGEELLDFERVAFGRTIGPKGVTDLYPGGEVFGTGGGDLELH